MSQLFPFLYTRSGSGRGSSSGGGFGYADIANVPNLYFRYRAAEGKTDGGGTTQATDGQNVACMTAYGTPTYAGLIYPAPGVSVGGVFKLDGTNNGKPYLDIPENNGFALNTGIAATFTRFTVASIRTGYTVGGYIAAGLNINKADLQAYPANRVRIVGNGGAASADFVSFVPDQWYVFACSYRGADPRFTFDGTTFYTATGITSADTGGIRIGIGNPVGWGAKQYFAEDITYSGVLTDDQIKNICNALKAYYGVA